MNEPIVSRAHGRVNLIGEHTDYNGGWVLPTAISQFTQVVLTKRTDHKVHIQSSKGREYTYRLGDENPCHEWTDYLTGATKLLREAAKKKNQSFTGFEAIISSTVPEGSGLSSSAALEISFLKAIREAFSLKFTDVELALIGQRIENEYVGARVGIMDQMACSLATFHTAIFLDTYTLNYEHVRLPFNEMDLLIINSGISHKLSGKGGYNERRAQCEEACRILGINFLRNITQEELSDKKLPELLMKRARHVVSENERVHKAVKAIRENNLERLGKLFIESHLSMKNDYEVSIPEIDYLVDTCLEQKATFGARLTGGGFGGSIVALTRKGEGKSVAEKVINLYEQEFRLKATLLSTD